MKQYKVFFLNAESIILDQAEYDAFVSYWLVEHPFVSIDTSSRVLILRKDTICYIVSEEVEKESKGVVVAPTPSELRAERHQEEQKIPVTLDDQLAPFQEDNKQLV